MKILILDDEQSILDSVRNMLEDIADAIEVTNDAKDAVSMIADGEYDFVLVDYKMPVNDGIWFMKNVDLPRRTKVLLMTAYVDRDAINEMFDLGAVGYLIKPFDSKELRRHLEFHSVRP